MSDAKSAWNDAGARLSDLGRTLRQHYDTETGSDSTPPTTPLESTPRVKTEVKDSLARLGGAVQDVIDAMGRAAKDPAVKTEVKQVSQSLTEALGATFSEVSQDLRKAFGGQSSSPSHQPPIVQSALDRSPPNTTTPTAHARRPVETGSTGTIPTPRPQPIADPGDPDHLGEPPSID